MATNATFIVNFGSLTDAYLTVELDEKKNSGKTSFLKGDTVYFKVYADCAYDIFTTSGSVSNDGVNVPEPIEKEILSFVYGEAPTTQKLIVPSSISNLIWFGSGANNLGGINVIGNNTVQATNATSTTLGICTMDYNSQYNEHTLIPPSNMLDTWAILILIQAK